VHLFLGSLPGTHHLPYPPTAIPPLAPILERGAFKHTFQQEEKSLQKIAVISISRQACGQQNADLQLRQNLAGAVKGFHLESKLNLPTKDQ